MNPCLTGSCGCSDSCSSQLLASELFRLLLAAIRYLPESPAGDQRDSSIVTVWRILSLVLHILTGVCDYECVSSD
jgi:hypothetical protein